MFSVTTFVSGLSKLNQSADDYLGLPQTVRGYKVIAIIAIESLAFFCFVESMRYSNHVVFLVNVRWDDNMLQEMGSQAGHMMRRVTPPLVARIFNTSNLFLTIGTRLMYLSIPAVMWLFGRWFMFGTGLFMLPLIAYLDFGVNISMARAARRRHMKLKADHGVVNRSQTPIEGSTSRMGEHGMQLRERKSPGN
ncbi:hypothetical protein HDU93_008356 [Gonapodya sp. JEL0774]|nr:hypothetical protein HDU93_008356 [Gonapodya sp. JEL0774]